MNQARKTQFFVVALAILAGWSTLAAAQRRTLTPEERAERERQFQAEIIKPRPVEALDSIWIEELTWVEIRDAIAAGKTSVIVPTGGIEQNGPYVAMGKHNYILQTACEDIARELGNALCAPIVKLVPEGNIDEPSGHMRYSGTISVQNETFEAVLEDVGRSLKVHGFENIILIGDSGGNQRGMDAVAKKLSIAWKDLTNRFGKSQRIHYISDYYDNARWNRWLVDQGFPEVDEDIHDDLRHESILMTVDPQTVRFKQRKAANLASINGVSLLNAETIIDLGNRLVDYHAGVTVEAVKTAISQ